MPPPHNHTLQIQTPSQLPPLPKGVCHIWPIWSPPILFHPIRINFAKILISIQTGQGLDSYLAGLLTFGQTLSGAQTHSDHVCRPTSSALKKNGLGRGQKCLKASFSGKHQKFSSNSTIVPSFPSTSRSITLARVGRWWRTPPSLQKKLHNTTSSYARQHKTNQTPLSIHIGRHLHNLLLQLL